MRIYGDVVKTMKTYLHFDERMLVEIGHQSAQKLKAYELQKARFDMIENLHAQGFVGVSGETHDGMFRKVISQTMYVVHPSHIRYLQEAENTISEQKDRIKELESALCETCKDPACEDSVVENLKQKVARLEEENERLKDNAIEWNEGWPKKHFFDGARNNKREWFLALLTRGEMVALTALPESYSYDFDFRTGEDTYIKKECVAKWSLLPESQWKRDFAASMTEGK